MCVNRVEPQLPVQSYGGDVLPEQEEGNEQHTQRIAAHARQNSTVVGERLKWGQEIAKATDIDTAAFACQHLSPQRTAGARHEHNHVKGTGQLIRQALYKSRFRIIGPARKRRGRNKQFGPMSQLPVSDALSDKHMFRTQPAYADGMQEFLQRALHATAKERLATE